MVVTRWNLLWWSFLDGLHIVGNILVIALIAPVLLVARFFDK